MDKSYIPPTNDFLVCTYATETYRPAHEFLADAVFPSGLEDRLDVNPVVLRDIVYLTPSQEEKYKNTSGVYH